jgi:hypothetical protein
MTGSLAMSDEPLFISQTRLSRRWGVSVRTLQRKRKDATFPMPDLYFGDIPHWKVERIVAFERELMSKALGEPTSHSRKAEGAETNSRSRETA